ncbi:MAG: phosphopentomutase [Thermodesulfovibrionales bacterium]|nr:phosphopentomutase [Thermodesulfovibrionales bacterium]
MPRFFIIVLDGVGAGAMPDASEYGDAGANTLGNLARAEGGLSLPVMGSMGLGNIVSIEGVPKTSEPIASWGIAQERSKGKDTITGHWEMMGIITEIPFPTYPDGFPSELIERFEQAIGMSILWGKVASGTEILERLGDEHMSSGSPIVYTSVDSVFQIAAHEDVIPPEELYDICLKARRMLVPPHNICRVIARPFVGPPFERTYRRRDFPVPPPGGTVVDSLAASGVPVVSVGKVADMFVGRGFSQTRKTRNNAHGMEELYALADSLEAGFVFANLVDFDTLWGHRNDTTGFAHGLEEFDRWLGSFLRKLCEDDHLIITADHGLDPTHPGTDHTREQVPVLLYGGGSNPRPLGVLDGFMDIGATVADVFGLPTPSHGSSMLVKNN